MWLVSDRDILLSNTIFQHFILLQYAILLLIVSCKNDCVLESVRPKTVELMLYLIVFKKKKRKKKYLSWKLEMCCFFLFFFVLVMNANSVCCRHISPSQCVFSLERDRNTFSVSIVHRYIVNKTINVSFLHSEVSLGFVTVE